MYRGWLLPVVKGSGIRKGRHGRDPRHPSSPILSHHTPHPFTKTPISDTQTHRQRSYSSLTAPPSLSLPLSLCRTYPCFGPIEVKLRIEWRVDADVVEGAGREAKGRTVIVLKAIPLHFHKKGRAYKQNISKVMVLSKRSRCISHR